MILTSDYKKGQLARAIPGAYYDDRAWHIERADVTPRAAKMILRLFPEATAAEPWLLTVPADEDIRPTDYATAFNEQHPCAAIELFPRVMDILAEKGWDLHDYQFVDLSYILTILNVHHGAYLGWQMGLGKTLGTCCLIDGWDSNYNLIVCPNSAKRTTWEPALKEYTPWLDTYVLPNEKSKRESLLNSLASRSEDQPGYNLIVHYEALALIAGSDETPSGRWRPGAGWKALGTWDLMVCDEGHRLKNSKAKFVKAAGAVPTVGRLLLSGSVIENHLEEMWPQLAWLFPKHYTAKWRQWNYKYLDYIDGPFGKTCIGPKEEKLHELRDEIGRFLCYRRSSDELDIPEAHTRDIRVELSPGQRRIYDELRATLRATLDDGTQLAVEEGLSLLSQLRQVATGLDLLGAVSDSAKLDVAEEMIRDGEDEVFVVFGWYRASLDALADRLTKAGVAVCTVHGAKTQPARDAAIAEFVAGKHRVLLATLATLAESVNLQNASQVIFLDRDWNPARNGQAEARVVRQGQTRNVGVTHIIAADTVDELRVLPTITSKEALRALILGGK